MKEERKKAHSSASTGTKASVTYVGMPQNPALFLQLAANPTLLSNVSAYQVVELPGGKLHARALDPRLREVSAEEAIRASDKVIMLGPCGKKLKAVLGDIQAETLPGVPALARPLPVLTLSCGVDTLFDVLPYLGGLYLRGCTFRLRSDHAEMNQLLPLTVSDENPDFEVLLRFDGKEPRLREFEEQAMSLSRAVVSDRAYAERLLHNYGEGGWRRNLHIFNSSGKTESNEFLYLTCTRRAYKPSPEQMRMIRMLEAGTPPDGVRETMEQIWNMLLWEELAARRLETLMRTRLVKITNMDDVIISFLGSRRCNLKCAYCFSDHTCEALAAMNSSDMLYAVDMLLADRPNSNVHFDNNLGGEPLADFSHVRERHATALAYHKTRGIRASFGLLTNGTMLRRRHLRWLRTHIPYLGFSLDGDQRTHDRLRRDAHGKPTYARTARGIRMLQRSNWPVETGVSGVISKYNLDIQAMQEHIRNRLNVKNIVMKPVRASSESDFALTSNDLDALKDSYRSFFRSLLDEGEKGNLEPFLTMLQPLDYAGRFLLRTFWKDRLIVKRCGCGEHIFSVSDDGRVFPCDSFNGTDGKELANLHDGFHNRSGFRVPYVTEENPAFGCQNCWARYLCGGVCQYVQHLNDHAHNDVTKMECGLAMFLVEESIRFWEEAGRCWGDETMSCLGGHIEKIGYGRLNDGALVYAPC